MFRRAAESGMKKTKTRKAKKIFYSASRFPPSAFLKTAIRSTLTHHRYSKAALHRHSTGHKECDNYIFQLKMDKHAQRACVKYFYHKQSSSA